MSLLQAFLAHINKEQLFSRKDRLLLAISGGLDSVVLARLLELAGFDFGLAHCNFQLRGEDSRRDEEFVRTVAARLNRPFYCTRFETRDYANQQKISIQVAARQLRYDWFESIRNQEGFQYILTAHHRDDNIETLLMNFFRGTGINGLTGIQARNGRLRRPLLFAARHTLESFLQEEGLSFVQDQSNFKDEYTRNYLRNQLIPELGKVFPGLPDNLSANIQRLKDAALLYQQSISRHRQQLLRLQGTQYRIAVLQLQREPAWRTILLELIQPFGFKATQLPDVASLVESSSGKYVLSGSHRILKDRRHLIITPREEQEQSALVIEGEGEFRFSQGVLRLQTSQVPHFTADPLEAVVDAALLQFPLLLRPWRQGDYFYPLGMPKKKKLSRFFIDHKLSIDQKEKIWVLEMNGKIIWIPGYRLDDRFKIKPKTRSVWKFNFLPKNN